MKDPSLNAYSKRIAPTFSAAASTHGLDPGGGHCVTNSGTTHISPGVAA